MTPVTVETFLSHFPSFNIIPRSEIQYWLDFAQDYLNKYNWGKFWERAVELYAAHNIALDVLQEKGMGSLGALQGIPASKAVDNVSKSYDTSFFRSGRADDDDGDYKFTLYGLRYVRLRNSIISPAALL